MILLRLKSGEAIKIWLPLEEVAQRIQQGIEENRWWVELPAAPNGQKIFVKPNQISHAITTESSKQQYKKLIL